MMSLLKKPFVEERSAPSYPVLERDLPFEASLELMDTTLMGLRRVHSMGCILVVIAAAFSQLHRLKGLLPATGHVCYVIHGSVIYVGHGNGDRKFGDRLTRAMLEGAQIYVLYSFDPRFDKRAAGYVEARFIDRLFEIGAPLANLNRPFGSGLAIDAGLEHVVRQAEVLLGLAGFRPLEAVGDAARRPAKLLGASRSIEGVEPVEPDQMPVRPPNSKLYRFNHQGMRAEGFFVGKTFYVQPEAEYAIELRRGMSKHNKSRRTAIEKFLEPLPGIDHRKRLRVGLKCKTSPIAAKVLSGKHIGGRAWQVVQ